MREWVDGCPGLETDGWMRVGDGGVVEACTEIDTGLGFERGSSSVSVPGRGFGPREGEAAFGPS